MAVGDGRQETIVSECKRGSVSSREARTTLRFRGKSADKTNQASAQATVSGYYDETTMQKKRKIKPIRLRVRLHSKSSTIIHTTRSTNQKARIIMSKWNTTRLGGMLKTRPGMADRWQLNPPTHSHAPIPQITVFPPC